MFALRVRPFTLLGMVENHRHLLRRRVRAALRWVARLAWALITLELLSLREPVVTTIMNALTAELAVGSLRLSLGNVLAFVLTVWLAFLLSRFIRFLLEEDVYPRVEVARGVPYAISTMLHYALLLLGFLLALGAFGFDLDKFTILAGAFGVGIGFGLQTIVNNFVSGLILLFERPVNVGDMIQMGEQNGELKRIGLRASVLRTLDGSEVIMPNSKLISDEVINWTLSDQQRRLEIKVGVAYGTDPERVLEILVGVAQAHPDILDDPGPKALFVNFGDNSLDFMLRGWTSHYDRWVEIHSELMVAINRALDEAQISIPFPQRDLHLQTINPALQKMLSNNQSTADKGANKGNNLIIAPDGLSHQQDKFIKEEKREMTPENEKKEESLEKYMAPGSLMKVEPSETAAATSLEVSEQSIDRPPQPKRAAARRKWGIRLGVLLLSVLIVAFFVWRSRRPTMIAVVKPVPTTITETIASSGRVGGVTETLVGAQAAGVVERLLVKEGDRVTAGQQLAIIKNNVAEAQVAQAEQAINTARAQLSQTSRGPLGSEVEAASEQVRQAQAQVTQQQAAVAQAEKSVAQARAQGNQFKAERELAAKQLARTKSLFEDKVIAQADYDQSQTSFRVADERVKAQQQAVELAQSSVRSAQAGLKSAEANVGAQAARLRTVQSGARPEDVRVAQQRLQEAERALSVARQQAGNAIVTAPFAGVVTAITAELGQSVGAQGVLKLVSGELEIRLDVDESNLADLSLGQTTIVSSSTFADSTFQGKVSEIGAAVDIARGTVQVTVIPVNSPEWLRPGQTVNVNIVTAKSIERLVIPPTAVTRAGDRNVVFVIENGTALEKTVVTRPPTSEGVPVLAGLTAEDRIIADVSNIKAGDAVRVRRQDREEK